MNDTDIIQKLSVVIEEKKGTDGWTDLALIGCYHRRQETTSNSHQALDIGIQHDQHIQLFIVLIGS